MRETKLNHMRSRLFQRIFGDVPVLARINEGFTMIEMMIVVVIISILIAIALPLYNDYIMRAKRADAKQELLQLAQWMDRYYTVNYKYPGPISLPITQSPSSGAAVYTIRRHPSNNDSPYDTFYMLEAVPLGTQTNDPCGTLSVDSLGRRARTGNETLERCWNN